MNVQSEINNSDVLAILARPQADFTNAMRGQDLLRIPLDSRIPLESSLSELDAAQRNFCSSWLLACGF